MNHLLRRFRVILIIAFLSLVIQSESNSQTASEDILEKSIQFHDPEEILLNEKVVFYFQETRPGGSDRKSRVIINYKKEYYHIKREVDGVTIEMEYDKGEFNFWVDRNAQPSAEEIEKYNLNPDYLNRIKDYYRYLWFLPVTLLDPGTIISTNGKIADFFGKESLEIKVTYDEDVGSDIWYFYFNPTDFSLNGYRFYHDESVNDGEYIIIDDSLQYNNLKIPKSRKWYAHKEDKYLGMDTLVKIEVKSN